MTKNYRFIVDVVALIVAVAAFVVSILAFMSSRGMEIKYRTPRISIDSRDPLHVSSISTKDGASVIREDGVITVTFLNLSQTPASKFRASLKMKHEERPIDSAFTLLHTESEFPSATEKTLKFRDVDGLLKIERDAIENGEFTVELTCDYEGPLGNAYQVVFEFGKDVDGEWDLSASNLTR